MNEFESAYESLDKTAFSLSRLDYNLWIYKTVSEGWQVSFIKI